MLEERSVFGKISKASVVVSGILLFGMSFFIVFEVLVRKIFSLSTQGAEEYSSYVLAFVSAWAFSFALLNKSHIRIDIVYTKLSKKVKNALNILSLASLILFTMPLSYYCFEVIKTSFLRNSKANTALKTPLWIPQTFWFIGILFFAVLVIVLFIKTVRHLIHKEYDLANETAGCPLIDNEIEEEKHMSMGDGRNN